MINDDVEERLREALRMHAAEAPPGGAMLSTVTNESVRRGRRTRLAAFSSGAAALVAIGAAIPFALQPGAAPEPPAVAERPSGTVATATPPSSATASLVASTVPTAIAFPYSVPALDGYGKPRIALMGGRLTSDQVLARGVSAILTVYSERPAPPTSKATVTTASVGGRAATVYDWRWSDDDATVPVPDVERTLAWQPAPDRWLTLRITPAAPTADLVAYAERVTAGRVPAEAPFTFGLMPAGWTVDNLDPAVVTFCPPGVAPSASYEHKLAVMLDETSGTEPKYGAEAEQVQVGQRRAWLTTGPEGQTLQIPQDGGRSVLLQIAPEAQLPRDLLLRFAATIKPTPAAETGHG